jgi:hypothetical protein
MTARRPDEPRQLLNRLAHERLDALPNASEDEVSRAVIRCYSRQLQANPTLELSVRLAVRAAKLARAGVGR